MLPIISTNTLQLWLIYQEIATILHIFQVASSIPQ